MGHEQPSSILYDARSAGPGMSGVGRYTLNLLTAMAALPERPPLRAIFSPEAIDCARRDPALSQVELIEAPTGTEAHPQADRWRERELPKLVKPGEVFHGPAYLIPQGERPFPRVVTIHDLLVKTHPEFYPWKFRHWMRGMIRRGCRHCELIIAPSQTVARAISTRELAQAGRIRVVLEAPDATAPVWDEASTAAGEALDELLSRSPNPLFITVATLDARKDPVTAQLALIQLNRKRMESGLPPATWIWIGNGGSGLDPTPKALAQWAGQAGFHRVGHVPGTAVRAALRRATAYVSCSLAEGFGIPLIEAQAAGCPLVLSRLPIHQEVSGPDCLTFRTQQSTELVHALERLLGDEALRGNLAEASLRHAQTFSWTLAASQTLAVYREALAIKHRSNA